MTERTISVAELRAHGICEGQLALFRATFGDTPVAVTEANMSRAVDAGLQIEWLARFIAPAPAQAAFEAARAPALAAYAAACAPALAAYKAARAQEWAAYGAADEQAWELYRAVSDQAWESYRRALVGPLVRALRAEGAAQFPRADS
jgi:hypothetical protein